MMRAKDSLEEDHNKLKGEMSKTLKKLSELKLFEVRLFCVLHPCIRTLIIVYGSTMCVLVSPCGPDVSSHHRVVAFFLSARMLRPK